jgi:predicted Rossmann fold nucleotide-binding protein DprA/Smf involved in DNA uptake
MTTSHQLSANTQAILLLTGGLGQPRNGDLKPLSNREWHEIACMLKTHKRTPQDLFDDDTRMALATHDSSTFDEQRIARLLDRSAAMALTVERLTNRGLWILSRADDTYPKILRKRLNEKAPTILYGAGNPDLLNAGGLAIVGSRELDDGDIAVTHAIATTCAHAHINVISGGAKGADSEAMLTALDAGGTTVGVLAESLEKASVSSKYRTALRSGQIALVTAYEPHVGFSVGNAMGRNKYIYAMSDYAVVIRSSTDGGTWNGAIENLTSRWVPTIVCMNNTPSLGNQRLIERGGIAFDVNTINEDFVLQDWLKTTQQHWQSAKISMTQANNHIEQAPMIFD